LEVLIFKEREKKERGGVISPAKEGRWQQRLDFLVFLLVLFFLVLALVRGRKLSLCG